MICEYLTSFTKKKMSPDLKCKNQSGQYLHGWVWVVINGIRADPQPRCGGLFGSVRGVCLFGPAIPWDTTRTLCLHGGGICDVPHRIGEQVPGAIYVGPLNQVDAF